MAVAYALDDALQLRSGLANVLIGNAEPIARGVLQVFTPVLSEGAAAPTRLLTAESRENFSSASLDFPTTT